MHTKPAELNSKQTTIPLNEKLAVAIADGGFRKVWIAQKFNRHRSWMSKVLDGTIPITDEMKKKFEELLKTNL